MGEGRELNRGEHIAIYVREGIPPRQQGPTALNNDIIRPENLVAHEDQ
jgi:hypothetical protein